jgi:hypothetical protein
MNTIKVGDQVVWRGSWGSDAPCHATIEAMELCEVPRAKYGIRTDEVHLIDKDRTVFTLTNGSWAYGYQIEPVKQEEGVTS